MAHSHARRTLTMGLPYSSLFLVAVLALVYKVLHRYFAYNPLDNVPGPAPHSIITGMMSAKIVSTIDPYTFLSGNMEVLFHRQKGWGFIKKLEECGSVGRIRGILGVRFLTMLLLPFHCLMFLKC